MGLKDLFVKPASNELGTPERIVDIAKDLETFKATKKETKKFPESGTIVTEEFEAPTDVVSIKDLYNNLNLPSEGNTIFLVKEFSDSLPKNLSTEVKRESVKGILKTSKIDIEELIIDGSERREGLIRLKDEMSQKAVSHIESNLNDIKRLEENIEALKAENISVQKLDEDQTMLIDVEIGKIEQIVKFLGLEGDEQ